MKYDDVIAAINKKAGHRRDAKEAKAALEVALTSAENGLLLSSGAIFYPWFLVSEMAHTLTLGDDYRVQLPCGFIMGYEEGELFYTPMGETRPYALVKGDLDDLINAEANGLIEGDQPQYYALTGNYYRIFPKPISDYPLNMLFYKRQPREWADEYNVNRWLIEAPKLIISMASIELMEDKRDMKGIALQEKILATETQRLYVKDVARNEINMVRERGLN